MSAIFYPQSSSEPDLHEQRGDAEAEEDRSKKKWAVNGKKGA